MALTEFLLIRQVFAEYFLCVWHCHGNVDGIKTCIIHESVPGPLEESMLELDRKHISVNSSAFIPLVVPASYSDGPHHHII